MLEPGEMMIMKSIIDARTWRDDVIDLIGYFNNERKSVKQLKFRRSGSLSN